MTATPVPASAGLEAVNSAGQLLNLTAEGREFVALLRRLGFWFGDVTTEKVPDHCRPFPSNISELTSHQIADLHGYWTSEQGRAHAMLGALDRERQMLSIKLKRARAQATRRALDEARSNNEKAPTAAVLASIVDLDDAVQVAEDRVVFVDGLIAALGAVREAIDGFCRVASREIARRGDLLRAGIAG